MSNNQNWQKHLENLEDHYNPDDFFGGQKIKPTNNPNISEHFFIPTFTEETDFPTEGQLSVDIYQDEKNIYVVAPVAGVKPDKLEVHMDSRDTLTIRGERQAETEVEDKNFLYQECYWGRFSRSVVLPHPVHTDQVIAKLENGVLKITLPKAEEHQKIKVKIDNA